MPKKNEERLWGHYINISCGELPRVEVNYFNCKNEIAVVLESAFSPKARCNFEHLISTLCSVVLTAEETIWTLLKMR